MTPFARHIALVGMPGAGKTRVGAELARLIGLPFHDLDAEIARREGCSVPDLFARGEPGFRVAERAALDALLAGPPAVVALGGGAFAEPATAATARRGAITVHLDADLATLVARVADGAGRPLLAPDPAGAMARLFEARAPAFAQADLRVASDETPAATAAAVVDALGRAPATAAVPVGPPGYVVVVGAPLAEAGARIAAATSARRALVVTDAHVGPRWAAPLMRALDEAGIAADLETVAAGEASKSWEGLRVLVELMAARRLARSDLVVALGGGVVGDLVGFAAAIYMRGLAWVQVPTTLLAHVDSSVGGKTAIDLAAGKNLAGAFHNPALVLIDPAVLATLPDREMRCGYAEIVKYGLIDHPRFFAWLETDGPRVLARDPAALAVAIGESVRAKARIVTEDPTEQGGRALLNLGHTFAHALEAESGFGDELKHGEAVAVGMALAFRFSVAEGLCPAADAARAEAVLRAAGLPTRLPDLDRVFDPAALVERMRGDKKAATGGALTLVLARGIGQAFVARGVEARGVVGVLRAETSSR